MSVALLDKPGHAARLDEMRTRLDAHYRALAAHREAAGLPIFVLEHCLTPSECDEIAAALRVRLQHDLRLAPYWLLWIVHITERGYAYAGDEFWRSFEEQTPGWTFQHRPSVSVWFKQFQKSYRGVAPSGPWSQHFSIIAWPVTHAILPRILQSQLARTLYDLRFDLAHIDRADPHSIGELLAASQSHLSTRLAAFLEQQELAGHIVLALLKEHPKDTDAPIHLPTLSRIVSDLEKMRSAKHWFDETRRVVKERFRGLRVASPAARSGSAATAPAPSRATRCDLLPELVLRHVGAGTWALQMDVPCFRPIAKASAELNTFLQRTRCQLSGGSDFKPSGWLLHASRSAVISRWPQPGQPLIRFEKPYPLLEQIIAHEATLADAPSWLFRIGPDGIARHITSRLARPGSSYMVLIKADKTFPDILGARKSTIKCEGISAYRLDLARQIDATLAARLKLLGIDVARTINIWPAGLPALAWDGQGRSRWLTTDAPCLAIASDFPVCGFDVQLDSRAPISIPATAGDTAIFVQLEPLSAGTHRLFVRSRHGPTSTGPHQQGVLELDVRAPEPWIPGTTGHDGLIATLDPPDADLDSLWQNKVKLAVFGPTSRAVTCRLDLERVDGTSLLSRDIVEGRPLPLAASTWSKSLADTTRDRDAAWAYLEASVGRLTIESEDLGYQDFRFERTVAPLRWISRVVQGQVFLRLIDDTGGDPAACEILCNGVERPLNRIRLDPSIYQSGIVIDPPGGMFVARIGQHRDQIILSAVAADLKFDGLALHPSVDELRTGVVSLAQAADDLSAWYGTRAAGHLAGLRQRQVTEAICETMFETIGGASWAEAERVFRGSPRAPHSLALLKQRVDTHAGLAVVAVRDAANATAPPVARVRWLTEVANRYGVATDTDLCRFALLTASQPHELSSLYRDRMAHFFARLSAKPVLLRAARLVALITAFDDADQQVPLLPRWSW